MVDANRSWRKVKVTDRRANQDFAVCMRDLVDAQLSRRRPDPRRDG
jgi:hypothetical protein